MASEIHKQEMAQLFTDAFLSMIKPAMVECSNGVLSVQSSQKLVNEQINKLSSILEQLSPLMQSPGFEIYSKRVLDIRSRMTIREYIILHHHN